MSTNADAATANAGSAKGESANANPPVAAPTSQPAKKDSTIELPLIDLGEAINFVSTIHEKALENAQMPQVATSMGYKHPSSTPFYRRCVAARLFGLMAKSGVELMARTRDYMKPDGDGVRTMSLNDAIMGIPLYADEVNRHIGKKMNLQFVANSFAKNLPITETCAAECARVFETSLKFAGFLSGEGVVSLPGSSPPPPVPLADPAKAKELNDETMQSHTLYLDKTKKRRFSVSAPFDVTPNEVHRIQKWLEVTLLMDWTDEETTL